MASINTNYGASIALQNLNKTNSELERTQNRINTGMKVSSAKDSGAIFAIATSQRANASAQDSVRSSIQRGQSIVDVALAAGDTITAALEEMKGLAVSIAGSTGAAQTSYLAEYNALGTEIASAITGASFDGVNSLTALGSNAAITAVNTGSITAANATTGIFGTITLAPSAAADGIDVQTGAPASVAITPPVFLGANQTWTVADAGTTLNLADVYKNNNYTLVWFYPKALTGGCTKQGCSLRDASAELKKLGVAVVGVSADTVEKQKEFKEKNNFDYPLLADTDKKVIKAFGQSGLAFASREAYLIDRQGKVVYHDKGQTEKQAEMVLAFLKKR